MKILTIAGTRPELIRLSIIIRKLDEQFNHVLVYTNQNYDYNLSGRFFDDLKIRKPNYYFTREGKSFGDYFGNAVIEFESILIKEKPDKILVLGDTNSGLLSIVGNKYGIPIYHMEAGNRCYDDRLPEESNRRIIDSISTYNLPYTENSKQNLLAEGYHKNHVFTIGNPINEVVQYYLDDILNSTIAEDLNVVAEDYVLVTIHRSENADCKESIESIIKAINTIANDYRVIFPIHPRTASKLNDFGISLNKSVVVTPPMGFFDFVWLENNARCVLSDSGTVQEECCIFGVSTVTVRKTTERQETVECGSNILSGTRTDDILNAFGVAIKKEFNWTVPGEYLVENVSDTVVAILASKV